MRSRYLLLGAAAAISLAVVVLAIRHGDDTAGSAAQAPSPAPAQAPSQAPARAEPTPVPTPSRPAASTSAPRGMPREVVSASAARRPSAVPATSIPTELPDSPGLHKTLSRDGAVPDYRESYTYQLGLMASYDKCMGGRIAKGVIYYYIHWQIDEDHVASSPAFEPAGVPTEGHVTKDDEVAFAACVKAYLATHDQMELPHAETNEAS